MQFPAKNNLGTQILKKLKLSTYLIQISIFALFALFPGLGFSAFGSRELLLVVNAASSHSTLSYKTWQKVVKNV